MTGLRWPGTARSSALAGLTTWVTLLAWTSFAERPSGYLVPILAGCVLVASVGMVLRAARWRAPLVLLAQLAVLAFWLHHRWAGPEALGGWLPTGASVHEVARTLQDSALAAAQYAAPVPKSVPQFDALIILTGCAVAVLVDFIACGLRRAPLAGLPLLAVYTAPVSILDGGVSWLKFAVAAMCFLLLIASQEADRLAHWGRQVSATTVFDSQATTVASQAVWSSARKIGLTAIGIAVVLPLFVPTFSGGLFRGNGGGGGGNGDAVDIANPMVDMKRDLSRGADVELVRVSTPDPDPSYLRLTVLDSFDGQAWRPSGRDIPVDQRADGLVPRPPGLESGTTTRRVPYRISTSSYFRSRWLPAPYPVYSVNAPGDWRYDVSTLDFISAADNQTAARLDYRLQGLDVTPSATELMDASPAPASVFGPGTQLPHDLPRSIGALARRVTAGAQSTFEQAVMLQRWFRVDGHFRYSLDRAPGNGADELVHFLGTGKGSRVGYCEQFAAAMAVMGRTLNIPSRVAVGFLRPTRVGGTDTYVYSSHDLHAWPEMYFQGVGWVRFEPTPQARTGEVPGYTRGDLQQPLPTPSDTASGAVQPRNKLDRPSAAANPKSGAGGSGSGGLSAAALVVPLVLLGGAALLAAPRLLRGGLRRRAWATAETPGELAETAWGELRATAADLGLPWDDRVTLRARARALVRCFADPRAVQEDPYARGPERGAAAAPEAAAALDRLVHLLERARYARSVTAGDGADATAVRRDTELCVEAMRAGVARRTRVRAAWLPASLWRTRGVGSAGTDPEPGSAGPLTGSPGIDHAV